MENNTTMDFEFLGYSIEYYLNNKYVGSVKSDTNDRPTGYAGRRYATADKHIFLTNGIGKTKKIRKGQEYYTEVIILCGKLKGSQAEKYAKLRSSVEWLNEIRNSYSNET
tara:strand:+ start:100 stop:429 length:330 start_codon:yes stop_codon:yes gene_type:complete